MARLSGVMVKINQDAMHDEAGNEPGGVFQDALELRSHGLTIYADGFCRQQLSGVVWRRIVWQSLVAKATGVRGIG